jgi:cytoskeletal protein RodZ
MSEKNESDHNVQSEQSRERVGDIIRKERISRRITVETIAKDLKLNVKYIKSLEASEYEALPADPYIRVYFRSLAKYLSLDSEDILKKFYAERGIGEEQLKTDATNKITISVKEKPKKSNPTLAITIILIIALAIFSFLANKKGWITTTVPDKKSDSSAVTQNPLGSALDSIFDDSLIANSALPDSLIPAVSEADTQKTPAQTIETSVSKKPMRLKIEVSSDSVWGQVFADGKSWKSTIISTSPREFIANDSFNVHMANNPAVKYTLNGKTLRIKGNGVVYFKIDNIGTTIAWSKSKWETVFSGRL